MTAISLCMRMLCASTWRSVTAIASSSASAASTCAALALLACTFAVDFVCWVLLAQPHQMCKPS